MALYQVDYKDEYGVLRYVYTMYRRYRSFQRVMGMARRDFGNVVSVREVA